MVFFMLFDFYVFEVVQNWAIKFGNGCSDVLVPVERFDPKVWNSWFFFKIAGINLLNLNIFIVFV